MVPVVGIEPTRPFRHAILSRGRLPVPTHRHRNVVIFYFKYRRLSIPKQLFPDGNRDESAGKRNRVREKYSHGFCPSGKRPALSPFYRRSCRRKVYSRPKEARPDRRENDRLESSRLHPEQAEDEIRIMLQNNAPFGWYILLSAISIELRSIFSKASIYS